ncbi:hypothetical protein AMJ86_03520 [bacterium SM23_57]|nr:MAG: hypothetical protein AMJ86_03520 [bacterium SM23_57]
MKVVTSLTVLMITIGIAAATIIHVPGDYLTIQQGVNAASPGDTVMVDAGFYEENIQMTEGITLIGAGWDSTTIDGRGITDVISAVNVINIIIEGFTIQNSNQGGSSPGNIGIHLNPHASTGTKIVRYCRVRSNGKGIDIWNDFGGVAYIEHNIICNNIYDGFDPYLGTTYLTNNTISYNQRDGYHDWAGGGAVYIKNNIFVGNGRYGIYKHMTTPVYISYNDVWENVQGAYYEGYSGPPNPFTPNPGTGEISADPLFADPPGDLQITWVNFPTPDTTKSPCIDAGDPSLPYDPDSTVADMGALYFNQSLPDIVVTLTPYGAPIEITTLGGSFDYHFRVDYNETIAAAFDGWIMLQWPDSTWHGPEMGPLELPAQGIGTFFEFDSTYEVMAGQHLGTYTFEARIGSYPDIIWDIDTFTFDIIEDTVFVPPNSNSGTPTKFALHDNYPNPFNPITTISYTLPSSSVATLNVYNITGQHITTLASGWHQSGTYNVTFKATNLSSGIYIYQLQSGNHTAAGKMILLK